jgi:hypothetical protein
MIALDGEFIRTNMGFIAAGAGQTILISALSISLATILAS